MQTQDKDTVDAEALVQKLKDKIHLDIATLMPKKQWDKLLLQHINTFLNEHTESDQWGHSKTKPPLIKAVVHEALTKKTREKTIEMLESEKWQGFWEDGEEQATEHIKAIIKEAGPDILYAILQREVQAILGQMRHNMQSGSGW